MPTLLLSWNTTLRHRLRSPENIQTVWNRPECFGIMWNYPDSLNPVWENWDHLKIYWQLWNCPEKLRSSGKLRIVLKPSRKFEKSLEKCGQRWVWKRRKNLKKIWKNPENFKPSGKFLYHLDIFGQFWNCPYSNHVEIPGQFWHHPENFRTIRTDLSLSQSWKFWNSLTFFSQELTSDEKHYNSGCCKFMHK